MSTPESRFPDVHEVLFLYGLLVVRRGEELEEELLVELGLLTLRGSREQLVGDVHHDAVVAGGVLGDGGLQLGGHQPGVSRRFEQVVEAEEQLFARGVVEMQTAADAAAQGHEVGMTQPLGEPPVTDEDDAEERLGVELLAGQDAQLVQDGREHFLGLVDDEHGPRHRGGDVLTPALPERLETTPAIVGAERDAEDIAQLAVEVAHATLWVIDRADDHIALLGEARREEAQGDALSCTRVAVTLPRYVGHQVTPWVLPKQ